MQSKIKDFRHFMYRKKPYKAFISDLQVKIPYMPTLSHCKAVFALQRNPKMLNFREKQTNKTHKKQCNPTFFFIILSFVQILELSPVFSRSQDFSFDVFTIF